jgi:hypothetical protein
MGSITCLAVIGGDAGVRHEALDGSATRASVDLHLMNTKACATLSFGPLADTQCTRGVAPSPLSKIKRQAFARGATRSLCTTP